MSRIPDLGSKLERLGDILAEYDQDLREAGAHLTLPGKTLEKCLQEQSTWPWYIDERKAELDTILKYVDTRRAAVRGRLTRKFTETYTRELSDRVKDKYIDNDEEYLAINEIYLEVSEMYEKFRNLSEAFNKRGFSLRDITQLRINKLEQSLL